MATLPGGYKGGSTPVTASATLAAAGQTFTRAAGPFCGEDVYLVRFGPGAPNYLSVGEFFLTGHPSSTRVAQWGVRVAASAFIASPERSRTGPTADGQARPGEPELTGSP